MKHIIAHSRENAPVRFDAKTIGAALNDLFGTKISSRRVSLPDGTTTTQYSDLQLSTIIDYESMVSDWIPSSTCDTTHTSGLHHWSKMSESFVNGVRYTLELRINTVVKNIRLSGFSGRVISEIDLGLHKADIYIREMAE